MASLNCLPNELIFEILGFLDQNSITSLCQTSSNLNKIGNSKLKQRIVVVPKTKNNMLLDNFELLQTFTYGFTKVKEDHFTDLYSRGFFNTTKELACLDVYKRKKLLDYKVKLPLLKNFFTFDTKSYEWYEDFIQYLWTPEVNIGNQYQSRIMQRAILPSDRWMPRFAQGFDEFGNRRPRQVDNDEYLDSTDSEPDEDCLHQSTPQPLKSSTKLYTKMDEKLEYFKFSNYSKFKKLKYLYLSNTVHINDLNFILKLTTALFLSRFDHFRFAYLSRAWRNKESDNEIVFVNRMPEYSDDLYCQPKFTDIDILNIPIKWINLKELRFSMANMGDDFLILSSCLESVEFLYIHDINLSKFQEQILEFILNIKENILQQIIIFSSKYSEDQVESHVKEKLETILRRQNCLKRFTIRYGKSSSFEVTEFLNRIESKGTIN